MTCRWWGRRFLGTCNITQLAETPRAGISAVAAFSCTCILSETANQPKLDISGQNGYFCKFLGFACQPHYFSAFKGAVAGIAPALIPLRASAGTAARATGYSARRPTTPPPPALSPLPRTE